MKSEAAALLEEPPLRRNVRANRSEKRAHSTTGSD
jgi:hypothetical protein